MLKRALLEVLCGQRQFSTWLEKFDSVLIGTGEQSRDKYSKLLAKQQIIYEVQVHDMKPGYMTEYTENSKDILPAIHKSKDIPSELFGQFSVAYGQLDRMYTIWKYQNGYQDLELSYNLLRSNNDFKHYDKEQAKILTHRSNQICYQFSFWPDYVDDYDGGFFEIRSYRLKPGSLYEWGNAWARGIKVRNIDAVMGLASQIGEMYVVHHIWRYKDLVNRKEERDKAWTKSEWGEVVVQTVPLIKDLEVNIVVPTDFSPLK